MSKRGRFRHASALFIQVLRASMTSCESFLVWVGDMGLEPGSCFSLACLYIFGKSVNDACSAPQYCSEYIAHMYIRFSELSPSEQTPKWNHSTKWRKPSVPRSIFIQKGNLLLRNLGCKNSKKDGNSKSFLSQAFSQTPILHKMLINRKSLELDWVS